jgi:hypothetical protein
LNFIYLFLIFRLKVLNFPIQAPLKYHYRKKRGGVAENEAATSHATGRSFLLA